VTNGKVYPDTPAQTAPELVLSRFSQQAGRKAGRACEDRSQSLNSTQAMYAADTATSKGTERKEW